MKVSSSLGLKITLWLLLNLVVLAAAALAFVVVQGGLGWSALLAGRTGDRFDAAARNVVASSETVLEPGARAPALTRLPGANGAEFYLLRLENREAVAALAELPAEVRARLESLRGPPRPPFGRDFGPGGPGRPRKGDRGEVVDSSAATESGENATTAPTRGDRPVELVPSSRRREPPEPGRGPARFLERAGSPASYWIGTRFFNAPERGERGPVLVIARVDSFWALLQFLQLEAWILGGTAVLGLSVLFWLPLVGGITRAIRQLTTATERIAEGRFDTRVSTRRRDELGQLGDSVNRMAARLDTQLSGQKRFLGDVAHELCSPLARLQMASSILAEQAPPALQPTVGDVREEVNQLSTLVNELLAFTKAGLRPRDVALSPIELAPLLDDVLGRESATDRVQVRIAPGMRALAEPDLLRRALANLVRNALRYAGDAGPILVHAERTDAGISLLVDDSGAGVPAADLDRLGEPFFRPELARTRESGGVGLGLAIVRTSVAACGGEVRFANRTPRGFRAEIRLAAA